MRLKPYSSSLLALHGFILVAMGVYFIFLRPYLLPEDTEYIGTSLASIENVIPGLSGWLQKVFWVLGSYILSTGLLFIYIARTTFRRKTDESFWIVAVAGITSIGFMVVVNFIIHSDFRWVLFAFSLPWAASLALYKSEK